MSAAGGFMGTELSQSSKSSLPPNRVTALISMDELSVASTTDTRRDDEGEPLASSCALRVDGLQAGEERRR